MGRVFDFIGTLIQKPDGLDVPTFSPFAFIDLEVATDSTLTGVCLDAMVVRCIPPH